MAKILILGSNGQLGFELCRFLPATHEVVPLTRAEADLRQPDSVRQVIEAHRPAVVINAAADTAVDRAESHFEECRQANAVAPGLMAEVCGRMGARFVHFSTDYVFDGTKAQPYDEDDETNPINAYGRAKLEGEGAVLCADPRHLVFRLSWVYSYRGRNFALTMLRLAKEGKPIRVVADQIGSPSYAPHIASAVAEILAKCDGDGGLYHLTAPGQTSWHGFAERLLRETLEDQAPPVAPIATSEFPTPAKRPTYSVLSSRRAQDRFGVALPPWEAGVHEWAANLP